MKVLEAQEYFMVGVLDIGMLERGVRGKAVSMRLLLLIGLGKSNLVLEQMKQLVQWIFFQQFQN